MVDEIYETAEDGLRREIVGPWVRDKHHFLQYYVDATRAARTRMGGTPCYVDLYCGPGQVRVRDEASGTQGGTLAAVRSSLQAIRGQSAPFSEVFIGDIAAENVEACHQRLQTMYAGKIHPVTGSAADTVAEVARLLPKRGIHLAYLDPYAFFALPYSVIETLGRSNHVDLIIHFAANDMSRNVQRADLWPRFDETVPGWREACTPYRGKSDQRHRLFAHWTALLTRLGYHVSERWVPVRNTRGREIYRLVLASKSPLGPTIWNTLRDRSKQTRLFE